MPTASRKSAWTTGALRTSAGSAFAGRPCRRHGRPIAAQRSTAWARSAPTSCTMRFRIRSSTPGSARFAPWPASATPSTFTTCAACQNDRMSRRRQLTLWLSAALFTLNAAIAWRMFHVEYLSQTGTGVGVIIAYARYARDNWPDLGWCRFWYAGLPLRNAYVPGVPLTAGVLSGLAHIGAGRAFYMVVAFMYCLGPVTLFWMAFRLTHSAAWSF